jgi:integrase
LINHENSGNILATDSFFNHSLLPTLMQLSPTLSIGQRIKQLPKLGTITLAKVMPCGSLQARKLANGAVMFYWRYSIGKFSARILIGPYDSLAAPKSLSRTKLGYSIQAALSESQNHAQQHLLSKSSGGFQRITIDKKRKQVGAAKPDHEVKDTSLKKLLESYCDHLKALGKSSYKDAASIFKVHVFLPWGKLSLLSANEITTEQIADILRAVHEKGLQRTSNKLRSYLRAAYQVAQSSKTKASTPSYFKVFEISSNPASDTQPDASANKSDKNPLSEAELITYWKIIKNIPESKGAALQVHLLTGGLRIQQLVQLESSKTTDKAIELIDKKGRAGATPRSYTTPLVKTAQKSMKNFDLTGLYAFSTDSGKTHIANTTLSNWAKQAVGKSIKNFSAKRVRSGVETFLAQKGFSKDWRGRLQSHGISGIQDRHYDGYDYFKEKLEMLEVLESTLKSED